jgi:hypothetical protein
MFNSISIHETKRITALHYDDLESAPVTIRVEGSKDLVNDRSEITLHTYDHKFAAALTAAINSVDESRQPPPIANPFPPQIDDPSLLDDTEPF